MIWKKNFTLPNGRKVSELTEHILAIAKDIKSECSYGGNVKLALRLADTLLRLAEENRDLF